MSKLETFDQASIGKMEEILEELVDSITELNETLKDCCSLLREQRKWKLEKNGYR